MSMTACSTHSAPRPLLSALCLNVALAMAIALPAPAAAVQTVPTLKSILGNEPGDDYYLANYSDSIQYFQALAAASDRIKLFTAGTTTQGRTMHYAVISSPENLARFDHYKEVSRQLADSRGLTDAQAKELAKTSKIIVHIDGGMHASEVADHQLPLALAYKLLSEPENPEAAAIMDNVILVLWPTLNPDGQDMVVDWYRKQVADKRTVAESSGEVNGMAMLNTGDPPMPWLYQEYVGHDNNRDGYMLNMIESQAIIRAEQEYSPAIWYSQHQVAPFPARIWVPPFADPISSNISPYVRMWTTNIGINMMSRFQKERKPGAIAQAGFDNWYPGFLDYTMAFRHTISYFTETAHSSATPRVYKVEEFPKHMQDLKVQVMYPSPWKGGLWRLKDSVDYMMTASLSTLETAVKYREDLLYNRYQAGRDTIARFRDEGPYAYVLPAGQADAPTAALLAQKLIDQGVEVSQANRRIALDGKTWPAGSWVIAMDQPFAGLVQELFETQRYPDAIMNGTTGKPVTLPYDTTGWTLPLQMGVSAEAVAEPLSASARAALKPVSQARSPGGIHGRGTAYALSRSANASFAAINTILDRGGSVAFADVEVETVNGREAGAAIVTGIERTALEGILAEHGVTAVALKSPPAASAVSKSRIGLYRPWGSNMDEGWTRWLLEQYGYAPLSLYNPDIKAGALADKVDTLILPDMGGRREGTPIDSLLSGLKPDSVPAEYAGGIGEDGVQALKDFVSAGGTLIAFNKASDAVIEVLELPVTNVLKGLSSEEFFCSGALLELTLGEPAPANAGLPRHPIAMFERGPAFETQPGFQGKVLASYAPEGNPLRSGVLLYPERIQGKAAALEVEYGKGKVYLYGFRPQWRGQSHGTYRFVFNPLYLQR
ncbi:M14 family zinc carboxypeptidase [Pseudoxanthomonas wuyuanensis]